MHFIIFWGIVLCWVVNPVHAYITHAAELICMRFFFLWRLLETAWRKTDCYFCAISSKLFKILNWKKHTHKVLGKIAWMLQMTTDAENNALSTWICFGRSMSHQSLIITRHTDSPSSHTAIIQSVNQFKAFLFPIKEASIPSGPAVTTMCLCCAAVT